MSDRALPATGQGNAVEEVLLTACDSCGGNRLVLVGQFVTWEDCLSCGRHRVLAWSGWPVDVVNLSDRR